MASSSDLASLQGAWRFRLIEVDGQRYDFLPGQDKVVTVEGDEWVSAFPIGGIIRRNRFALDPGRHRFDFLIGPGLVTPGLYSRDGDRLTICVNQRALKRALGRPIPGDESAPPTSLSAPPHSGYRLWVLERAG